MAEPGGGGTSKLASSGSYGSFTKFSDIPNKNLFKELNEGAMSMILFERKKINDNPGNNYNKEFRDKIRQLFYLFKYCILWCESEEENAERNPAFKGRKRRTGRLGYVIPKPRNVMEFILRKMQNHLWSLNNETDETAKLLFNTAKLSEEDLR